MCINKDIKYEKMADENIISVSSAAAESDPGNAENFLLGILPVSQPHHT